MNSQKQYLSSNVMQNVMKEVKLLMNNPLEDIRVRIKNDNIRNIEAIIMGPTDTPYSGGEFVIYLHFSNDFPQIPPKGYFLTKIFHPNVAFDSGEICLNTLKRDWKPDYGLTKILVAIRSLLIVPNADSALNEEAAKLLLNSYDDYARRAKLFTQIHAKSIGLLNHYDNKNEDNNCDQDDDDNVEDDDDSDNDDNDNENNNDNNVSNTTKNNKCINDDHNESKNMENCSNKNNNNSNQMDFESKNVKNSINKNNNDCGQVVFKINKMNHMNFNNNNNYHNTNCENDVDNNYNERNHNNNENDNKGEENKEFNNIQKNQNQHLYHQKHIKNNGNNMLTKSDKKNKQNKMQSKLSKSLLRL